MDFFVGGEPDFVVDVGLFEDDAGALLEVGEEAAGNFHVVDKEGVEADDVEGFFVYPDDAAEFLDDFFDEGAGFEFGVGLEVEDQDVLAAEAFAARIDELAGAEESVYGDVFVFFFLLFLLVRLAGGGFLVGAFFQIVNFLQDSGVFFFLGFGAEGLAVDFHEGRDFGAVEVEEGGFADVGLFGLAVAFVFGFFFDLGAGVVFFNFVEGLLVGVNLFEEGFRDRGVALAIFWGNRRRVRRRVRLARRELRQSNRLLSRGGVRFCAGAGRHFRGGSRRRGFPDSGRLLGADSFTMRCDWASK